MYSNVLALSSYIVFQPGGVKSGCTVTTWADVKAYIALRQGNCDVLIDDHLAAAHVPATTGVTNCFGRVTIRPAYTATGGTEPTLIVDNGAQLLDLYKVEGFMNLSLATTGALPGLGFSFGAGVLNVFFVQDNATVSMAATATAPGIIVDDVTHSSFLAVTLDNGAVISGVAAAALVSIPNAGDTCAPTLLDNSSMGFGAAGNTFAGPGTLSLEYGPDLLSTVGGGVPQPPTAAALLPNLTGIFQALPLFPQQITAVGTVGGAITLETVSRQIEAFGALTSNLVITIPGTTGAEIAVVNNTTGAFTLTVQTAAGGFLIPQGQRIIGYVNRAGVFTPLTSGGITELVFLATTANVLGALQASGVLPAAGTLRVQIEGFGGTGGGGGGVGGATGAGGGASGGCHYSTGSFDHNLAHALNIGIGAGGGAGAAGAAGGGSGGNGTDGTPSTATDGTTAITLAALAGSSGGQGGTAAAGAGKGGASLPGAQFLANIAGFEAAGGNGAATAVAGVNGNEAYVGFGGAGGVTLFAGGAGGASAGGQGGGGGGGGAGPFAAGGNGGSSTAGNGNPGAPSIPNQGNGAGGGAGGTGAGNTGGAGGAGAAGWVKLSFATP